MKTTLTVLNKFDSSLVDTNKQYSWEINLLLFYAQMIQIKMTNKHIT